MVAPGTPAVGTGRNNAEVRTSTKHFSLFQKGGVLCAKHGRRFKLLSFSVDPVTLVFLAGFWGVVVSMAMVLENVQRFTTPLSFSWALELAQCSQPGGVMGVS